MSKKNVKKTDYLFKVAKGKKSMTISSLFNISNWSVTTNICSQTVTSQ